MSVEIEGVTEVKLPTVGRIVHYFPNGGDPHCSKNGAEVVPATVIQVFSTAINLVVTCMNPDGPVVCRYSVNHKSTRPVEEGTLKVKKPFTYWDWPEIK